MRRLGLLWCLVGCGTAPGDGGSTKSTSDSAAATDTDPAEPAATDTDADPDSGVGGDSGTEEPDPPSFEVAFVPEPARTDGNPFSGFFTSYQWGDPVVDMPESMEYVVVPMADLMVGPDEFSFETGLEPYLVAAEARGNQVVLRPYIDYPALPSGLPAYLDGLVALSPYSDHGGGWSPDYADPDLLEAIDAFIEALGTRYDGDPRLAVVQLGLLGFWGEWHTWPHSEWFPDVGIQNDVLHAYDSAFSTTLLQVRVPNGDSPSLRIGFHDDSFAYSTVGEIDWFFVPLLEAAGAADRWMEVPIGGELRPELQEVVFDASFEASEFQQHFLDCVEATHASFLLNYHAFSGIYDPDEQARAQEAARAMGYAYHLATARLEDERLTLSIENLGVAPFYPSLRVVVTDALGGVASSDLPRVLPGTPLVVEVATSELHPPSDREPWTVSMSSDGVLPGAVIRWATAPSDGPLRVD